MLPGPRRLLPPALALAFALSTGSAWALDARIESVRQTAGHLWLTARLERVLAPRVRDGLARGMPATLTLHVELWRRRAAWFDRLEGAWEAQARVRYDIWSDTYQLERGRLPGFATASLDSLEAELERPIALRLASLATLRPGDRYYVACIATLKPLTVEDAREIEGWLSGEVQSKRRAGLGAITGLPLAVFDAVRNVVGLGDESGRAQSADFLLAERETPEAP